MSKKYLLLEDGSEHIITGENAKYYFCDDTQLRKMNKAIVKVGTKKAEKVEKPEEESAEQPKRSTKKSAKKAEEVKAEEKEAESEVKEEISEEMPEEQNAEPEKDGEPYPDIELDEGIIEKMDKASEPHYRREN